MGSHFHHGHVSRGPPIIPDGRISRVRFGNSTCPLWAFPSSAWFKRWFAYAPTSLVRPSPRSSPCASLPRLWVRAPRSCWNRQVPESLRPISVLPPWGRRVPPPQRALPLLPCSCGLMRRSHLALLSFGILLVRGALPVTTSPGCQRDLPDVISANLSLDARSPATTGPQGPFTCFFPCGNGLPQIPK